MAESNPREEAPLTPHATPGAVGAPVTDARGLDVSQLMSPRSAPRGRLAGFDPEYVDIVDYIVRITHKIWEEGNLGAIYDYYLHDLTIHTSDGLTLERDKVVAESLKTLAAFPNLRLYADDVIWSGDAERGFHTSHRITWSGRNTGYSRYGPPTNRVVVRQGIAHCFVKGNRILEEWICRDELALVQQLGFEPVALAQRLAAEGALSAAPPTTGEALRRRGQLPPERLEDAPASDPEGFVYAMLHNIWNCRMLGALERYAAPQLCAHTPGFRTTYGLGHHRAFILGLLAAFPDLALVVDHQCSLGDERAGYRVATRWFVNATHDGPGPLGPPSGKPVTFWGISHHEIRGGKVEREWMLFDLFAVLKQIHAPS